MYVYIEQRAKDSPTLYSVGFYDPNSKFHPESDYSDQEDAAWRVHFLNGGSMDRLQGNRQTPREYRRVGSPGANVDN